MTIATVMVCLALDQSNQARMEIAGQLAERFGAGLVGIAAAQFAPPLYFTDGEQAQSVIEQGEAAIRKRLKKLEEQFRQATKGRAAFVDWRGALEFPARFVLKESRCADIVVTGGKVFFCVTVEAARVQQWESVRERAQASAPGARAKPRGACRTMLPDASRTSKPRSNKSLPNTATRSASNSRISPAGSPATT